MTLERVEPGSAHALAGLQPGDVLRGWRRVAAAAGGTLPVAGRLDSLLDLELLRHEIGPRGPLVLEGLRGGRPWTWLVPLGTWGLTAHGTLTPALEGALAAAEALAATGSGATALEHLAQAEWRERTAASALERVSAYLRLAQRAADYEAWDQVAAVLERGLRSVDADESQSATLLEWLAEARLRANQAEPAARAAREALALRERLSPGSLRGARSQSYLGQAARRRGANDEAERHFQRTLELRTSAAPGSLELAAVWQDMAMLRGNAGRVDQAEAYLRQALAVREVLAPDSLDIAVTLSAQGLVARTLGQTAAARALFERARALLARVAPRSAHVTTAENGLAMVASDEGDYARAQVHYEHALRVVQDLYPGSLAEADTVNNLAVLAADRGDLRQAEHLHRRALELRRALAPDGLAVATSLHNLGIVAYQRADFDVAQEHYLAALAIRERQAPGTLLLAGTLHNLGNVARVRGDLAGAEAHYRRALEIKTKWRPDSVEVAFGLTRLAQVALARGDVPDAAELLQRALAIAERDSPNSRMTAVVLQELGGIAARRDDVAAAERDLRRAVEITARLVPESAAHAHPCRALALLLRRQGRRDEALALMLSALDALDAQRGKLGGDEATGAAFSTEYAPYYHDTLDLLLQLGRRDEAFHVLERYRARRFLALMEGRDLDTAAQVPPELDRERRRIDVQYDRAQAQLARAGAADVESRQAELRRLRRQRAELRARIGAAAPRWADLAYPQPLELAAAQAALDPGTLCLSFSIGPSASHVFALGPGAGEFTVAALDADRQRLEGEVARLRQVLARGHVSPDERELRLLAARLGDTLLAPVAGALARARRVLLVPDGPLHVLPFAALQVPGPDGRRRYLIELAPLHVAPSISVAARWRRAAEPPRPWSLAAFGDPTGTATTAARASLVRADGERLTALPGARDEVLGLRALFPGARIFVGADATEDRARQEAPRANLVHFACHGLLDERVPLDSGLALARSSGQGAESAPRGNGLLQAWEIFEQLRLDAELVTLSACDTATGAAAAGEGLQSLTRAFQFAGARRVLASLWPVSDASTAELMRRFYTRLSAGASPAEALQAAQAAFVERGGAQAHPFHWAAFTLHGDWR